jgi:hypothetical protein
MSVEVVPNRSDELTEAAQTLQQQMRGQVGLPSHLEYHEARRIWNAMRGRMKAITFVEAVMTVWPPFACCWPRSLPSTLDRRTAQRTCAALPTECRGAFVMKYPQPYAPLLTSWNCWSRLLVE